MVKLAAITLVALTSFASARPPPPPDDEIDIETYGDDDEDPAFNMFGFRMSVGALPLHGRATTLSIGLGVEHPVFVKTRMFGDYEWLWLLHHDERAMDSVVVRPERHANGHRASIGLRREVAGKRLGGVARMFLDGELGGSVALINDNMTGVEVVPAALLGVRFGYDLYSSSDSSPSRTFEAELMVRAIAVRDGIGAMFGVGMLWGN